MTWFLCCVKNPWKTQKPWPPIASIAVTPTRRPEKNLEEAATRTWAACLSHFFNGWNYSCFPGWSLMCSTLDRESGWSFLTFPQEVWCYRMDLLVGLLSRIFITHLPVLLLQMSPRLFWLRQQLQQQHLQFRILSTLRTNHERNYHPNGNRVFNSGKKNIPRGKYDFGPTRILPNLSMNNFPNMKKCGNPTGLWFNVSIPSGIWSCIILVAYTVIWIFIPPQPWTPYYNNGKIVVEMYCSPKVWTWEWPMPSWLRHLNPSLWIVSLRIYHIINTNCNINLSLDGSIGKYWHRQGPTICGACLGIVAKVMKTWRFWRHDPFGCVRPARHGKQASQPRPVIPNGFVIRRPIPVGINIKVGSIPFVSMSLISFYADPFVPALCRPSFFWCCFVEAEIKQTHDKNNAIMLEAFDKSWMERVHSHHSIDGGLISSRRLEMFMSAMMLV